MINREMKEFSQIMDSRADFYRFLSSLFLCEVSLEVLENLSSLKFALGKIGNFHGLTIPTGKTLEKMKEELDIDFARIFLGLGPLAAFPYESIYKSRLGLLMQEPFDEARTFYSKAGIKKNPNLKEPEDHIGIELAFMANLSNKAGMALKEDKKEEAFLYLEMQKEFLQGHLSSWIPSLCKDILIAAQTEFYKTLANLLNSWISSDGQELDQMIKLLKFKD